MSVSRNAAVERREARRPASSAGDPWRSRDRPDREAGHGVRRFRTQRLSALCPLDAGHKTTAPPRRKEQGRRSVGFPGCLKIESVLGGDAWQIFARVVLSTAKGAASGALPRLRAPEITRPNSLPPACQRKTST